MLVRSHFRRRVALLLALALAFAFAATPAYALSRSTIMARGTVWTDAVIPYSQTGWANTAGATVNSPSLGWRRDCSGFVSMSWVLGMPGQSTRTLHYYAERINKASLQPGDILTSYNNHTVLFGGWADPLRKTYYAYEMSSSASRATGDGTVIRVTPYPYWNWPADRPYLPYRYPGVTGNVDYRPHITAVEGATRYATAIAASTEAFAAGEATAAIVASGINWPDALGASALAGAVGGPVLLTDPRWLPNGLAAELARLGVTEVIVVGSERAVSRDVARALDALPNVSVTRIGGADRYETSRLIAEETARRVTAAGGEMDRVVFVATGANFPDALAAAPLAYATKRPVLLTRPTGLSGEAAAVAASLEATGAIVLGSTQALASQVASDLATIVGDEGVRRIAGPSRYETALALAQLGTDELGLSFAGAAVATGEGFPDALAGGAMSGRLGTVLLLSPSKMLHDATADILVRNAEEVGRPRVLGSDVVLRPLARQGLALTVVGQ